jgi:type I restriction enzyme S subunit
MPADLVGYRVDDANIARIGQKDHERLSRHHLKPGDIVYGRRGDIGRHALITGREQGWLCGTGCLRVRFGNASVEPQYVSYYLRQSPVIEWILSNAVGTTIANLNTAILESVPLELPPLPVQQRIADVLGVLDDKIEVNQRINRALEQMAQALFRHWFVDFGPFQGGEFVESELGPIPAGWQVGTVSDILELAYGKGLPKRVRIPGSYPVFGSSGQVGTHTQSLVRAPGIIVGRKGTIGSLYWTNIDFWPIDTTYYVIPRRSIYSFEYLYYVLSALKLTRRNNDSAVPGLNRDETHQLSITIPADDVLERFNRIIKPWYQQMDQIKREISVLAATRDYLLPRLLSGEVTVPEGEALLAT